MLVNTLDPFAEMQKDISRFEKLGKIILMGDFNARNRNLSDLNYLNQSEFITSLLEDNDSDINMRNSSLTNCHVRDKGVNSYGKSLIDICCTNQLCILNGRTKGDRFGNFTCFTYNGCSTVDYAIISNSLFSDVIYFTVHPLSLLSNHGPISFALRTGKFSIQPNSDDFLNSKPQSFKWHSAAKLSFQTILNSQEIINKTSNLLHNFEYKWYDTQNSEIDKFLTETNEIINHSAKLCLPLKK